MSNPRKEEIDKKFNEVLKTCLPELSNVEIMDKFRKVMGNRILPAMLYDSDVTNLYLYRVTIPFSGFNPEEVNCYSYPPNPTIGRANIKNYPVFYGSQDPLTAISEMKERLNVSEKFYISKWVIQFQRKTLAHHLTLTSETIQKEHALNSIAMIQLEQLTEIISRVPEKFEDDQFYIIKKMGDLYTSPSNSMYHITSAYSHDILYSIKDRMNIPIIVYPSVERNQDSVNWAIHPRFVNSECMKLNEVFEVSVLENKLKEEDKIGLTIHKRGLPFDNKIKTWQTPQIRNLKIVVNKLKVVTISNEIFTGNQATLFHFKGRNKNLLEWLEQEFTKTNEFYELIVNSEKASNTQQNLITSPNLNFEDEFILISENGMELILESKKKLIQTVEFSIRWSREFQSINN